MCPAQGAAVTLWSSVYLDLKPITPGVVMFAAWMDNSDGRAVCKSNWPPWQAVWWLDKNASMLA